MLILLKLLGEQMNLLKRLSDKKKTEKIENYFDFYLNSQISTLNKLITNLSTLRRKDQKMLRTETIQAIIKELEHIDTLYSAFLQDLNKIKTNFTNDNAEKIFLMEQKKKSLRQDFEAVYSAFKRTAIGLEDIPMKSVLKKMLIAFKFVEPQNQLLHEQQISNF